MGEANPGSRTFNVAPELINVAPELFICSRMKVNSKKERKRVLPEDSDAAELQVDVSVYHRFFWFLSFEFSELILNFSHSHQLRLLQMNRTLFPIGDDESSW